MVAAEVDEVSTPFALGQRFCNANQTTLAGQPIHLGVPGRAGQNDLYRVRTTAPRSELPSAPRWPYQDTVLRRCMPALATTLALPEGPTRRRLRGNKAVSYTHLR